MLRLGKADAAHKRSFSVDKSEENTLETIPLEYIRPNPYQPRRVFSEVSINELAASIKRYGLIAPIAVRKQGRNYYEIIAGERRWRAMRRAGFTHIKAIDLKGLFLRLINASAVSSNPTDPDALSSAPLNTSPSLFFPT